MLQTCELLNVCNIAESSKLDSFLIKRWLLLQGELLSINSRFVDFNTI